MKYLYCSYIIVNLQEDCHVNIIRSLVNDSDEEIESVMQLYIMFEYTNLLTPKPQPQRTTILKGHEWGVETLNGHPRNCYETFRMTPSQFIKLCELLKERKKIKDNRFLTIQEQVAIFFCYYLPNDDY